MDSKNVYVLIPALYKPAASTGGSSGPTPDAGKKRPTANKSSKKQNKKTTINHDVPSSLNCADTKPEVKDEMLFEETAQKLEEDLMKMRRSPTPDPSVTEEPHSMDPQFASPPPQNTLTAFQVNFKVLTYKFYKGDKIKDYPNSRAKRHRPRACKSFESLTNNP